MGHTGGGPQVNSMDPGSDGPDLDPNLIRPDIELLKFFKIKVEQNFICRGVFRNQFFGEDPDFYLFFGGRGGVKISHFHFLFVFITILPFCL